MHSNRKQSSEAQLDCTRRQIMFLVVVFMTAAHFSNIHKFIVMFSASGSLSAHAPDESQSNDMLKHAIVQSMRESLHSFPGQSNMTSSLPIPASRVYVVDPVFQKQYNIIDNANIEERCTKYRFKYNQTEDFRTSGRRIFFGAMVADEEYDLMRIHAAEVYGLYDVVALIESDQTFTHSNRTLRWTEGTPGYDLVTSGIFGPHTRVYVDLFQRRTRRIYAMEREDIQRQKILKRWKMAGMQPSDVAIMADIDETMTREFLQVAKHCDIPSFRPKQNCQRPRIHARTLIFEGSPECVVAQRFWYHPDFMIGECIESIGDPRGRPTPKRKYEGVRGERVSGWGMKSPTDYPEDVIKNGSYPLANGADMRIGAANYARHQAGHIVTGYHFHNFFASMVDLRHKYLTYGHPVLRAKTATLSEIHSGDVDLMVRCARDLPNSAHLESEGKWNEAGLDEYNGLRPIFFYNETYRRERHMKLKRMIADDERIYGSIYNGSMQTLTPIEFETVEH